MDIKPTIKVRINDTVNEKALWYAKYEGKFLDVSEPKKRSPLCEPYYEYDGFGDQKIIFCCDATLQ